jgi:hypothetical protein
MRDEEEKGEKERRSVPPECEQSLTAHRVDIEYSHWTSEISSGAGEWAPSHHVISKQSRYCCGSYEDFGSFEE